MRITKSLVDKLPAPPFKPSGVPTQQFYRDSAIPGFGVRITSHGAISFIVEKRINGKVKRLTLGRYGNLTVEEARKEAQKVLGKVAKGEDPLAEKREKKLKSVTLLEAFEDYLITRKDLRPGTVHDYRRSINGSFADWQNLPLREITKDKVEARHLALGRKSHARANNAMRLLRALFNHARHKYEDAKGQPILPFNPVDRLSQVRAWYRVERRRTVIKPYQLQAWYEATLQLNYLTSRDYMHFLLFTGLRRSEAARLTWAEVDFNDKTFTIRETKNGRAHTLPFSDFLEGLLRRRHEEQDGLESPYVFPSATVRGYLIEPRSAVERVCDLSSVTFTLHDLRRTFITVAESLDIPAYALKRLLNHKDPNDVTAGYIVSDVERLRRPMQKVADYLKRAVGLEKSGEIIRHRAKPSNQGKVVDLHGMRVKSDITGSQSA